MSKEELKFASEEEALQHLANITGNKIVIASVDDAFIDSYIETMLWSSNDDSDETGGEPMDKNYNPEDIHPDFMKEIKKDCKKFIEENYEYISDDINRAAHDFWLTRNGHGAGFWDGDWDFEIEVDGEKKNAGDYLTEQSKEYGEVTPYITDDGKIDGA